MSNDIYKLGELETFNKKWEQNMPITLLNFLKQEATDAGKETHYYFRKYADTFDSTATVRDAIFKESEALAGISDAINSDLGAIFYVSSQAYAIFYHIVPSGLEKGKKYFCFLKLTIPLPEKPEYKKYALSNEASEFNNLFTFSLNGKNYVACQCKDKAEWRVYQIDGTTKVANPQTVTLDKRYGTAVTLYDSENCPHVFLQEIAQNGKAGWSLNKIQASDKWNEVLKGEFDRAYYDPAAFFRADDTQHIFLQRREKTSVDWAMMRFTVPRFTIQEGKELSSGDDWNAYYESAVTFKRDGVPYLFAQSNGSKRWFISELKSEGFKGAEISSGKWNAFYESMVTFECNGVPYLFAQSDGSKRWFISELTADKNFNGHELSSGSWNAFYESMVTFECNGVPYLFAQSDGSKRWFISELKPKGFKGDELSSGSWNAFYESMVTFERNGIPYLFAQNKSSKRWFISELKPRGFKGDEKSSSTWNNFYETLLTFNLGGIPYLFAHGKDRGGWFVSELKPDSASTVNREIVDGDWRYVYKTAVSFYLKNEPYIFGQCWDNKRYFIEKFGNEWQNKEVGKGSFPIDTNWRSVVAYYENIGENDGLPSLLFGNGRKAQIKRNGA